MDQRKVNMLAREYCDAAEPKIKFKPVILSHRELLFLARRACSLILESLRNIRTHSVFNHSAGRAIDDKNLLLILRLVCERAILRG